MGASCSTRGCPHRCSHHGVCTEAGACACDDGCEGYNPNTSPNPSPNPSPSPNPNPNPNSTPNRVPNRTPYPYPYPNPHSNPTPDQVGGGLVRARELPCPPAQLLGPRAVRGGRVSLPRALHRRGVRGARTPSTLSLTLTLALPQPNPYPYPYPTTNPE